MPKIPTPLEKEIEDYLVKRIKEEGGEIRKLKWSGRRGAPDRMIVLQGVHFAELKRPGEKPDPHQYRDHAKLLAQGVFVAVLDNFEKVDKFVQDILDGKA